MIKLTLSLIKAQGKVMGRKWGKW